MPIPEDVKKRFGLQEIIEIEMHIKPDRGMTLEYFKGMVQELNDVLQDYFKKYEITEKDVTYHSIEILDGKKTKTHNIKFEKSED